MVSDYFRSEVGFDVVPAGKVIPECGGEAGGDGSSYAFVALVHAASRLPNISSERMSRGAFSSPRPARPSSARVSGSGCEGGGVVLWMVVAAGRGGMVTGREELVAGRVAVPGGVFGGVVGGEGAIVVSVSVVVVDVGGECVAGCCR